MAVDTRDNMPYDEIAREVIAAFHRKQLDGVDWQTAAIDLQLFHPQSGEYFNMSAPSEDCDCDTCKAEFGCDTCGGSGWITLTEYPTLEGETTTARCIECGGR